MTKKYRGFTLIELLVVIAIIGILASIVLVSLTTARSRAYDAEIKSELSQVRADAEMYFIDNDTYVAYSVPGTLLPPDCSNDSLYQVGTSATAYAAWAGLCSTTANDWCVDSAGMSKEVTGGVTAGATVCP
ncbi:prepilin-type N-terminal cleavage/methylation domain-containing protein [Patescibacteria group bacterium]|nr:prepilin-type N-terminal cleavage/methylation domain-containing protein [Patescibacteria group bacterium]